VVKERTVEDVTIDHGYFDRFESHAKEANPPKELEVGVKAAPGQRKRRALPRAVTWSYFGQDRPEKNAADMYEHIVGQLYNDHGGVSFYRSFRDKIATTTRSHIGESPNEADPEGRSIRSLPGGWYLNVHSGNKTAQTSAAVIPDRMDRPRAVTSRKLPAELRHLDDCDLLNDATLDVLRHGYVVVHREKIIAEARQGRETANFLLGALGGADILDPWQANLIHGATSFQWASGELSEYVADREGQRKALQRDFRKAVRAGLRQRCTVLGSDGPRFFPTGI